MKIYLDSVGCRLNQAEIEKFATQFHAAGMELVSSAENADVMVLNTCTVTAAAASDSRQKIRQAARAGCNAIIATGCLATVDCEGVSSMNGVISNVSNANKDRLVETILKNRNHYEVNNKQTRIPIPGVRGRTRAFIKAQDGCDQHCTFCITRLARGKTKSVEAEDIIADVTHAEEGGAKEVVICGVQLGSWGMDFTPKLGLKQLVEDILQRTSIPRIRLSSIEPWNLDDKFFDLWQEKRICRQLHLPLQSGSPRILELMGRKNTIQSYKRIVEQARATCPVIAITTDVLVGFPSETDDDFNKTLSFIEEIMFAGGHVFSYSPRPGTGADLLQGRVSDQLKKERSRIIRELLEKSAVNYQEKFEGRTLEVLWESNYTGQDGIPVWVGWTDNYIKAFISTQKNIHNKITPAVMKERLENGWEVELV